MNFKTLPFVTHLFSFIGIASILVFAASAIAEDKPPLPSQPIRSGAEIDYPPFSIVGANGLADGFSVELFRAALAAMDRNVSFHVGPWFEVRDLLELGEIEALPLVGRTPEREEIFDFTFPYMSLHGAIVVRTETSGIRTLADLKGRQVAVMKGDNAEEFLRREDRGIDISTTPTFEDALRELSQGRHDAVVLQRLVALRLLSESGITNLKVIETPIEGFRQDFCFAVREGDRQTLALLNEGLALIMADGTYRRLHSKWFAALQLPANRSIIVGGDHNYPPFEYLDEKGRPTGFTVELTRAIAEEMNMAVQIRLGPWADIVDGLRSGEIDAIQGMFYSSERDRIFEFSPSYLVSNYVGVVRRDSGKPPETVADLDGKSLVVQQGDVILDMLAAHDLKGMTTVVETQEDVLRAVSEGGYDCALVPRITSMYLIDKNGWTNLVLGRHSFFSGEYSYAAPNGETALLAQFNEGLKILKESGEYRRIYEKWMGLYEKSRPDFQSILRYIAMVALPLLSLLLIFVLWWWSLRRQVAHKTRELQESADRFKYIFEAANVGKSLTLPSGEMNVNQAFADMLGYDRDELQGKTWKDLTPAEDIETTEKVVALLLAGIKNGARLEKRYVHKSGVLIWADVSAVVRRDSFNKPIYFVTTVVDITERKSAEEALRKSEEYQHAMIECSPVALYSIDLQGRVLTWNTSAERIFGWTAHEVIGTPLPIISDAKFAEFTDLRLKVGEGSSYVGLEVVRNRKDGTIFDGSLSLAPIRDPDGNIIGIMGAMEDITERKRSQLRIEHLNRLLRTIRDVNKLIVRERDKETLIREGCRLLVSNRGYPSAMIVLTDGHDRPVSWAMEGLAAFSAELTAMLERGNLPACCTFARKEQGVLLVRDRQNVCVNCPIASGCAESQSLCVALTHAGKTHGYLAAAAENNLVVDEEERNLFNEMAGDFAYALSVIEREAEHRQGEVALRESESRFRLFAELAPVGIVISDDREKTLFASSKFTELFGYTLEDMPSVEEWWALAYPEEVFRRRVRREWQTALEGVRRTHTESKPMEYPVTCKDGSVRHVEFRFANTDTLNVFVLADITERKRVEEERENLQSQLVQAQKMETVGRLAGGVAHDYNNMLSVIIGFTELALAKVTPGDPLGDDLREVLDAALRAAEITRQLLAFARKQTIAPQVLDLNDTVESMLKMLRRLIGEDINLFWQPGADLWMVNIDPSQLDQILANLCVNSRDAISDVGKISIETGNVSFDDNYCAYHGGFVPGDFVLLTISDDGCGMDKATLGQLFEPFFTTKTTGKGTGLGLATVYGIVKQNSGFINVYSEPEKGSTFRIYLPRHVGETDRDEAISIADIPQGRGETVLIVEDEAPILKMTGKMLEKQGYTVLEAMTPKQAVELAEKHRGGIHLLITDVVMPEMNGRDLAEGLQTLYPEIKVLFMSGYTADLIAHRGVLDAGVNFLQKPFSNRDLAAKVRDVLAL